MFWSHLDFVKMFNIFSTVLIIDYIYKTIKYRLPIMEIVGVTSTEMTFSTGFAFFFESGKEDNVTCALEMCKTMLKDQENVPQIIVTNRDTAVINSIATMFSTSSALLRKCHTPKFNLFFLLCIPHCIHRNHIIHDHCI